MRKITYKTIIITIFSLIVLAAFVNYKANKLFLFDRTLANWKTMQQLSDVSDSTRMLARWGKTYYASLEVKKICERYNYKDPLILFEPNSYYFAKGMDFKAPEPIIFYYFTGLHGIWMDSKNIDKATHLLVINNQEMTLQPIQDSAQLASIKEFYKDYKIAL